ncbi:DNA-formamidopyrimidine glycosylase family protein, partial [Bacillus pumilus]
SHLRMEGKYRVHEAHEPYDKHVHVVFTFTDGTELRYHDVRKFGTMHLFQPLSLITSPSPRDPLHDLVCGLLQVKRGGGGGGG